MAANTMWLILLVKFNWARLVNLRTTLLHLVGHAGGHFNTNPTTPWTARVAKLSVLSALRREENANNVEEQGSATRPAFANSSNLGVASELNARLHMVRLSSVHANLAINVGKQRKKQQVAQPGHLCPTHQKRTLWFVFLAVRSGDEMSALWPQVLTGLSGARECA